MPEALLPEIHRIELFVKCGATGNTLTFCFLLFPGKDMSGLQLVWFCKYLNLEATSGSEPTRP